MQQLLEEFAPNGPEQLLSCYLNRDFLKSLDFLQRKRFMALFRQYTVSVPRKTAMQVAERINSWLWRLSNVEEYSKETGMAYLLESEPDPACTII